MFLDGSGAQVCFISARVWLAVYCYNTIILSKGKGETPDTSDMAHSLGCLVWQYVSWDVLALFRLDSLLNIVLSLDALFAPGLSHCQRELR